jgi:shingomyelin synthase
LKQNNVSLYIPLTLPCLSLLSDSPKRFWWYHWFCWTLSAVGIFCILLAHDHYTVDVVVAYFITTRLFWWYHTMANQQVGSQHAGLHYLVLNVA